MKLYSGDALAKLKRMKDNSIDSVVTDPPYGLSFMGKRWDYDVPSVEVWREVLRVLKPGGHLLSFGGTRTYHRMVVNIEDAGFEIRDQVMWLYGSGFPKSQDVSKQIDKQAGAIREVVGQYASPEGTTGLKSKDDEYGFGVGDMAKRLITAPATPEAKAWQGWGTALKPANEPICVARKPLEKGLTVAQNVLKWGTGAMNIDASRIGFKSEADRKAAAVHNAGSSASGSLNWNAGEQKESSKEYRLQEGRWPANLILDEEAAKALDTEAAGSYSKFFYVAKASKRERNAGMPEGETNGHPTIKPIKLMEYLIKLVTPPGGIVLDPFMGSGTTGVAARKLGCKFIGIEREREYREIAERRIEVAV